MSGHAIASYPAILKVLQIDTVRIPTLRDAWLLRTAKKGDEQEAIVTLLVPTEGIDVNSKDEDRRTPLLWVSENDHKDIVKLLLARASANTEDTIGRHHSHSLP